MSASIRKFCGQAALIGAIIKFCGQAALIGAIIAGGLVMGALTPAYSSDAPTPPSPVATITP